MPSKRSVLLLAITLVLVGLAPAGASPDAAVPVTSEDPFAIPGWTELVEELRETEMTPEERAHLEEAVAAVEADPEAWAAWLAGLEEPEAREAQAGPAKTEDEGFGILRTNDRSKPVLILHGRDNYNMNGYAALRSYLAGQGFAQVNRIGYYGGECNVEHTAEHHGSHNSWFGGSGEHSSKTGCTGGSGAQVHDLNTDVRHIAFHVAWMVHAHYGASGVSVDMMGHSMGGLLMRYAIAMSGSGSPWPPKLLVEDAVTWGTPHGGLGTSWCKWSPWSDVRQMCSDSSMMTWMRSNAQDPQGNGGTDWTLIGSDCDGWVAWNLAVDMNAAHKAVYVSPCYGHSDYYGDVSTLNDATVDYMDRPDNNWYRWSSAPHNAKWTNYAAVYGTW